MRSLIPQRYCQKYQALPQIWLPYISEEYRSTFFLFPVDPRPRPSQGRSLVKAHDHPPLFVDVRRSSNFCQMVVNFYAVSSTRGRLTKAPSLKNFMISLQRAKGFYHQVFISASIFWFFMALRCLRSRVIKCVVAQSRNGVAWLQASQPRGCLVCTPQHHQHQKAQDMDERSSKGMSKANVWGMGASETSSTEGVPKSWLLLSSIY